MRQFWFHSRPSSVFDDSTAPAHPTNNRPNFDRYFSLHRQQSVRNMPANRHARFFPSKGCSSRVCCRISAAMRLQSHVRRHPLRYAVAQSGSSGCRPSALHRSAYIRHAAMTWFYTDRYILRRCLQHSVRQIEPPATPCNLRQGGCEQKIRSTPNRQQPRLSIRQHSPYLHPIRHRVVIRR